jgi:multidrug resistance efflux pump
MRPQRVDSVKTARIALVGLPSAEPELPRIVAQPCEPESPRFAPAALAAYRRGERPAVVLAVTGRGRWLILSSIAATLLVACALTLFCSVEETSAARGVLRAPFGVAPVVALIGGTLRGLDVQPGQRVVAGQRIAELDATPLEAGLRAAARQQTAVEHSWQLQRAALAESHARQVALTEARIGLLDQRQLRQRQRIARQRERADRLAAPELDAVLERSVRERASDALEGARDDMLSVADELSALRLALATHNGEYERELAAGEARVAEARAAHEAALALLAQSVLRAPISGRLESLRAFPGRVVQAGEWIARVVRDGSTETIAAFVPEREVAFLRLGAHANVEVDQLPVGEFGQLRARVVRIADELAEPSELSEAFGDGAPHGPHVRVELALAGERTRALRAGTQVTARIALRDRRLLALVFEPARRWLR